LKVLDPYRSRHQSYDEQWNIMYERLIAYHDTNGHFVVSRKEDPQLLAWIQAQRTHAKNKTLKPKRREKLDAVNFPLIIFKSNESLGSTHSQQMKWNDMYTKLLSFRNEFGDCRVPMHYDANPALGRWVSRHRHEYATGVLDDQRCSRLEQIDFTWMLRPTMMNHPPGISTLPNANLVDASTIGSVPLNATNNQLPGSIPIVNLNSSDIWKCSLELDK
jgi:Helicase associated domain